MAWPNSVTEGRAIVVASWVGTVVLAVTSILAVAFLGPIRFVHVAVALGMAALGCVLFLRAYWFAIQRSRHDEIGIGGLFFLAGKTAPKAVKVHLNSSLGAQVVLSIAAASVRPFTTLAFGCLAPMFGLGLNGLWGATYGVFGKRVVDPPRRRKTSQTGANAAGGQAESVSTSSIEQNADHG